MKNRAAFIKNGVRRNNLWGTSPNPKFPTIQGIQQGLNLTVGYHQVVNPTYIRLGTVLNGADWIPLFEFELICSVSQESMRERKISLNQKLASRAKLRK